MYLSTCLCNSVRVRHELDSALLISPSRINIPAQLTSHPRRRPIWQKDWEHCAFMSTPRAFANGGVIAAGGSGPGGERNQCLIMCGGYDEVPHETAYPSLGALQ